MPPIRAKSIAPSNGHNDGINQNKVEKMNDNASEAVPIVFVVCLMCFFMIITICTTLYNITERSCAPIHVAQQEINK